MPLSRDDLADVLDEIALLLELKGENTFKIRAYRNGAETVRQFEGGIVSLATENNLKGIKGIGEALQQKLHELASTGTLAFHQNLRAEFPKGLFDLFTIQGLGPKKVKALYDKLSIDSITALKEACTDGRIVALPGFGKKSVEKLLDAIALKEKFADFFRLGDVAPIAESILEILRNHPDTLRASLAGSYRRGKEILHDLDFLVATSNPSAMTQFFTELPEVDSIIACGETKAAIRLENGLQCDLRAVSNSQFPFALQYFSGSKEHNVALRSRALSYGWSLNEYDLSSKSSDSTTSPAPPEIHEEADIYRALQLQPIPAELRENRGEIEAADAGELPRLIELENLRGTFHNHTTESDGKNSLEEMAEAARELGLQYLGIADHSKGQFQANGLYPDRLFRQIEKIRELNAASTDGFHIFAGSEVDILKDGSLDFPDDVLSQLDYCVASIHNSTQLSEKEMTARIIRAMENPHVTMIGHLTGRLLLQRKSYALNIEKVIDCAAETGTIIELNCNPRRLDMDWRHWHRARDKGVMTSINPDAHHTSHLQFLALGIRLARKGWLRREDVLNTRSLSDVTTWLKLPKGQKSPL